ncbi:MAG: HD domain-containing phosphohydrolase, partial [Thermodesulfobacteriota bacterium]
ISVLSLWNVQRLSTKAAFDTASQLFKEKTEKITGLFNSSTEMIFSTAESAGSIASMAVEPTHNGLDHPGFEFMLSALERHAFSTSVYMGYPSGAFIQVVAVRKNDIVLKAYGALKGTQYIVRTITVNRTGERKQHWTYLDDNKQPIGYKLDNNPVYNPCIRPWYIKGMKYQKSIFSDPYVFYSLKEPGLTMCRQLIGKAGVFGIDFTLSGFSDYLKTQYVSTHGDLFIFDKKWNMIAHPTEKIIYQDKKDKALSLESKLLKMENSKNSHVTELYHYLSQKGGNILEKTFSLSLVEQKYLVQIGNIGVTTGLDLSLAVTAPLNDFTAHIRQMQFQNGLLTILVLFGIIPFTLWASSRMSHSLNLLSGEAYKIQQFDFSESKTFDSAIREIHSLIVAFDLMKNEIRQRTEALVATQKKLEILVDRGISLSAERDMTRLLEMIFLAAKDLSQADGGVLYLREQDSREDRLEVKIARNDALGININSESGPKVSGFSLLLGETKDIADSDHIAVQTLLSKKTLKVDDIAASDYCIDPDTCEYDPVSFCQTESILSTPLKTRQGEIIGVLQLINARDKDSGTIGPFQPGDIKFIEALASQAAIALDNKNLLLAQQNLMDSLIKLIADAIDAKSSYTGGHCSRMPIIASLLVNAANNAQKGPFKDFSLETEDEWKEFKTAAWLHDCGKVTTPEYVVDKATKLETLYNRIHEVRMRFEVLWRDAEIEYWQKTVEGGHDQENLTKDLKAAKEKIKSDFAFVAECNEGDESMSEERIERLKQIAAQTWMRNLDDGLGISQYEKSQKEKSSAGEIPVKEFILADKPEHIISRIDELNYEKELYDFNMSVPEHMYNLGELYNLSILKGTLNREERFKIKEHIIQTIIMLKQLPFPRHMARVPEYAGSHHENMIGTGYPRGLTSKNMSVAARIMSIADIFEALTASDRPYKKAKTINESLEIMSSMRNDQHIDPELFDLFLENGVWQKYAQDYLTPSQIDEVDIEQYLSKNIC